MEKFLEEESWQIKLELASTLEADPISHFCAPAQAGKNEAEFSFLKKEWELIVDLVDRKGTMKIPNHLPDWTIVNRSDGSVVAITRRSVNELAAHATEHRPVPANRAHDAN